MANIELPKDAEGREIPLDTVALYDDDGNVHSIRRFIYTNDFDLNDKWMNSWYVVTDYYKTAKSELMHLTKPDSWEKLEDDLDRCIEESNLCMYYNQNLDCNNCTISGNESRGCTSIALEDIKKRIRMLRGED
nr:MAG TPA: hypothetical protein [Caudoviricetes sp.]